MTDTDWQDAIRAGSTDLGEAINAARAGLHPGTPLNAAGLPRDYTNASGPKPDLRGRTGVPQGGLDQVAALMARKKSAGYIAKELDITVQKATWMMAGVRKRRTPSELGVAMRAKLWG